MSGNRKTTIAASVEVLSGIVRCGKGHHGYSTPFEFAIGFSSVDGHRAVIKALTKPRPGENFTQAHARAIISAVKSLGMKPDWTRFKLKITPIVPKGEAMSPCGAKVRSLKSPSRKTLLNNTIAKQSKPRTKTRR